MEDFVPFEIAKKLKEKGFKEKCIAYYWEKINEHTASFVVVDNMPDDGVCILDLISEHNKLEWSPFIDAPTISQVLKWLRKEKNIHIGFGYSPRKKWRYVVMYMDDRFYNEPTLTVDGFLKIEQASLVGIEYVLDNLI